MSFNSKKLEKVKVKVLVVDDHTFFAEGTVFLLSLDPRIRVVGIAKNGIECIRLLSEAVPDVVLLDINLPDTCGIDLIDRINEVQPKVKIIMLTSHNMKGYITKSISKGANGFLLKDSSVKEMVQGILKVFDGEVYFSQGLEAFLHPLNTSTTLHFTVNSKKKLSKLLNTKEIEIIELVTKGLKNKEIAGSLGLNVRTVDLHISNILFKLGVSTRMEAVLKWAYVDTEILYDRNYKQNIKLLFFKKGSVH